MSAGVTQVVRGVRTQVASLHAELVRWGLVVWLRALALSQSVPLDRLPPAERAAAERALR